MGRNPKNPRERVLIIAIAVFALWLVTMIAGWAWWNFTQEPHYARNVHGYMDNAYWANTPELMIENLERAKKGMHDLGLEEHHYGSNYPWEKVPNYRMDYQYAHLDSIIERAHDVIRWREEASHEAGTQAKDVYEEKMDNLRAFLIEGDWSDGIAHDSWSANKHPVYWWWTSWVVQAPLFLAIAGLNTGAILSLVKSQKRWRD